MIGCVYLKSETYHITNMIRERENQVKEYFTTRTSDNRKRRSPILLTGWGRGGTISQYQDGT